MATVTNLVRPFAMFMDLLGQALCNVHGLLDQDLLGQALCNVHGLLDQDLLGQALCNVHGLLDQDLLGQALCNVHGLLDQDFSVLLYKGLRPNVIWSVGIPYWEKSIPIRSQFQGAAQHWNPRLKLFTSLKIWRHALRLMNYASHWPCGHVFPRGSTSTSYLQANVSNKTPLNGTPGACLYHWQGTSLIVHICMGRN